VTYCPTFFGAVTQKFALMSQGTFFSHTTEDYIIDDNKSPLPGRESKRTKIVST
jgi:hypothetical protein